MQIEGGRQLCRAVLFRMPKNCGGTRPYCVTWVLALLKKVLKPKRYGKAEDNSSPAVSAPSAYVGSDVFPRQMQFPSSLSRALLHEPGP